MNCMIIEARLGLCSTFLNSNPGGNSLKPQRFPHLPRHYHTVEIHPAQSLARIYLYHDARVMFAHPRSLSK